MSWVKIESKALSHPKVLQVGRVGFGVWLAGLCWCDEQETDGFIPEHALPLVLMDAPRKVADALVAARLWHKVDGGFQVHDYAEFQPKAADKKAKRDAAKERMSRNRSRGGSRNVRANTQRTDNEQGAKFSKRSPYTGSGSGSVREQEEEGGTETGATTPSDGDSGGAQGQSERTRKRGSFAERRKLQQELEGAWHDAGCNPRRKPTAHDLDGLVTLAHQHGLPLVLEELRGEVSRVGADVRPGNWRDRVEARLRGEAWQFSPAAEPTQAQRRFRDQQERAEGEDDPLAGLQIIHGGTA